MQRLDGPLSSNSEDTNFVLLTGIWVVIALALYFMRPHQPRTQEETIKKLPFGRSIKIMNLPDNVIHSLIIVEDLKLSIDFANLFYYYLIN